MRKINYIVMLITLIVSTSYILGIELYDQSSYRYEELFKAIQLKEINYDEAGIEIEAVKDNDNLLERDVYDRLDEVIVQLSHNVDCSKLCTKLHPNHAVSHLTAKHEEIIAATNEKQDMAAYSFELKNKALGDKRVSYYKLKLSGSTVSSNMQNLYDRAKKIFASWKVQGEEMFYAKASVRKELTDEERRTYKEQLFKALEAKDTNYYKDDYSGKTEVYYGFTKKVKAYIKEADGQKTNFQISFTYDEVNQCTRIIVATPFYNQPF